MSVTDQILGWGAAAVLVGGAIKYARDYHRISAPTKDAPEPFSGPELTGAREDIDARMKTLGIKRAHFLKERDHA